MLITLYGGDKQRKLFRYAGFCALRYAVSECSEIAAVVMCSVLVLCSQLAKGVNSSNCRCHLRVAGMVYGQYTECLVWEFESYFTRVSI